VLFRTQRSEIDQLHEQAHAESKMKAMGGVYRKERAEGSTEEGSLAESVDHTAGSIPPPSTNAIHHPDHGTILHVDPHIEHLYLIMAGYFFSELFLLVLQERSRPDFGEMFLHHLTTIVLVTFAMACQFIAVASLVLLVHGGTDILIYFSKIVVLMDVSAGMISVTYVGLLVRS